MLLGLVQGPAEVLPLSSSGHMVLLGSRDKELEVWLHAGTALALVVGLRGEVAQAVQELDGGRFARALLTLAPAAIVGLVLEGPIERRAGGPRSVALAQIVGGVGLLVADRAATGSSHEIARSETDAGPRDALLIGLAQACALVPGVSRNGATLTAALLLGFRRDAASRMSRHAALPVIAGATALKLTRVHKRGGGGDRRPAVAGFAAAFASSLAAARLVPRVDGLRSYVPFALYRMVLGAAVLAQGRRHRADRLQWRS